MGDAEVGIPLEQYHEVDGKVVFSGCVASKTDPPGRSVSCLISSGQSFYALTMEDSIGCNSKLLLSSHLAQIPYLPQVWVTDALDVVNSQ